MWDADREELIWVGITRGFVHRYKPATDHDETAFVGQPVSVAVPRSSGGWLLAMKDGFGVLDSFGGPVELVAPLADIIPGSRMNDGKCDSMGRLWAGSMVQPEDSGRGALYRLETDYETRRVLADVTCSNGLGWSPDDQVMYFIDTATGGIDAFDYDRETGDLSSRRRLVTVPADLGVPDGMAVDAEGFLWVAMWGGHAVHRYAPDGARDAVIELPVSLVTSCAFGGRDLRDLYITTAAETRTSAERLASPGSGGLYRARPGVAGQPTHVFGG